MGVYAYHVRHRNGWGGGFGPRPTHCAECGAELPRGSDGAGTGYGSGKAEPVATHPDAPALKKGESLERSPAVCYPCCGKHDEKEMRETGRAVLYLSDVAGADPRGSCRDRLRVSNWPGSLSLPVLAVRASRNNFGAQRTDVWFRHEGREWHGVNVGDNQILRCRRLKGG